LSVFSFVGYIAILTLAFDEARKGPNYGAFYQKTVFGFKAPELAGAFYFF
jgi:hypothetical protein